MYVRRIYNARKAVAVAFIAFGIGLVISARQVDWHQFDSHKPWMWSFASSIFGIGMLACLVATASLCVEKLLRFWKDGPLSALEIVLAGVLGVAACVTFIPTVWLALTLYNNLGFSSVASALATCTAASLIVAIGLAAHRITQGKQLPEDTHLRHEFAAAALFAAIACSTLAAFVPLRFKEGQRQRDAVAALEQGSCETYYDYQIDRRGYTESKSLSWVPEWLAAVAGIDFFHRIVRVDVVNPNRDINRILTNLQALAGLRYIHLQVGTPSNDVRRFKSAVPSCRIKFVRDFDAEYIP